ncbi:Gfo/Idh/MocA family protein [Pelagibius sp. Alg239-R121]|uniref:Gfo/Idh/MocA family protein n=1 Tax=Pelagibius sp. Alg239-R121 TaxID=2993448 RepID=UPI0024A6FB9D|nr:Gfo/Idh/MocA family oxidoreductase [Pelagibius sp. Alg239-R121]
MTGVSPKIGLGLIGSGFMGKTHVFGFATAQRVFDFPFKLDFATVCDVDEASAEAARQSFGFRRASADWRSLLKDPEIDIVDITAPNVLHKEMALAAIAAGKHVYCEKPLAPSAAEALEMTEAAEAAGIVTQVGFNYLKNPMFALARDMIASGELGEIRSFRGVHAEDYMADANQPLTWRHDPAGGGGALADLGSHVLATARFLLGPIVSVMGTCKTLIPERPTAAGSRETATVQTEDVAQAFVNFENGATGSVEANWVATGRKMQHDFEVYGSKAAVAFSGERLNELRFYSMDDRAGLQGFRTILAGPDHAPYGDFCVAPGHQLGFNDLKAIEVRDFLNAIAGQGLVGPDFREGYEVQKLVEMLYRSAAENRWISLS